MGKLNYLNVGIGELKITKAPNKLRTFALGSCLGVAIYDIKSNVGGLAHILLSNSVLFPNATNKLQFADIAIPSLYKGLLFNGSKKENLRAKIAGGANLLTNSSKPAFYSIGKDNINIAKIKLDEIGIPIAAEATGGDRTRTMILNLNSLEVEIKYYEGFQSKLKVL